MDNCSYGAMIEYGKVIEIDNGKYRIESLSRPGIVSRMIGSTVPELAISEGDTVFFAMFDNGHGIILGRM